MANLGGVFNAEAVEPKGTYEPLPVSKYKAAIVDSEFKMTKAGDGRYLNLKFEVIDGEYKGRNLWALLNLDNPNPKAVEIAQRELSAICRAVNKLHVSDSSELHHLPMIVDVKIEVSEQYGPKNVIKGYEALGGAAPVAMTAATPTEAATSAQPTESAKKPWE